MTGGYKIIDMKNINFTVGGDSVQMAGIINELDSTNKPIMLRNLQVNNVKYKDFFVQFSSPTSGVYDANIKIDFVNGVAADIFKLEIVGSDYVSIKGEHITSATA